MDEICQIEEGFAKSWVCVIVEKIIRINREAILYQDSILSVWEEIASVL